MYRYQEAMPDDANELRGTEADTSIRQKKKRQNKKSQNRKGQRKAKKRRARIKSEEDASEELTFKIRASEVIARINAKAIALTRSRPQMEAWKI